MFCAIYILGLTAEYLVNTFEKIAQNKSTNHISGNGRNARFKLPSFGTEVDRKCMPLGFRWGRNSMPDDTLECDLATCSLTESSPVQLLACGHSFHAVCLKNDGQLLPCHLCWPKLKKEVTKLANSWNKGILQPQESTPSRELPENPTNTDSRTEDVPNVATRERGYYLSDSLSDDLKNKIESFIQPTTMKYASAEAKKRESNRRNQHQQTQQAPAQASFPNHQQQNVPVHTVTLPTIPSQHHGNVTFWMFPPNLSQSTILRRQVGSNACTVIAILTGATYAANASTLTLPHTGNLPSTWFLLLVQSMVNGNEIYDKAAQQTPRMYGVREAATLVQQRTRITSVSQEHQCDFQAPLSSARLSNFITKLDNNSAAVNIVALRTTVYLKSNSDFIFFDSHMHENGLQGAVLGKVNHDHIDDLLLWVRTVNQMAVTLGTVTIVKY